MTNLRTLALLSATVLLSIFLFTSCKKANDGKDGANGTAGTAGTAGAAGAAGSKGSTGIAGNTMLNGAGAPADTLGVVGDFYLDLGPKVLYGPKSSEGWGVGVSIQGADGEPGKDAIISVDTFTIFNGSWQGRDLYLFAQQTASNTSIIWPGMGYYRYNAAITPEILTTGLVIIDMALSPRGDPYRWSAIPFSAYAGDFNMNLDYRMNESFVEIAYYLSTNYNNVIPTYTDVEALDLPDYKVKVIVIPGKVVTLLDHIMKEQKAKVKVN